jgi:hypothetical protein
MTASMISKPTAPMAPLGAKDKAIVGLIVLFTAVALTLELYWLLHHREMEIRTDLFARIIAIYWPVDYTWRIADVPIEKAFTLSFERVNVLLTPILSAILVWAMVMRRRYRYPLQLVIATYTTYGTYLYFSVAHVSDYAVFADKSLGNFLLFYLVNLPWFAGYAWMGWDAYRALLRGERA